NVLILLLGAARLRSAASRARVLAAGRWFVLAREISDSCGMRRRVTLLQTAHPTLLMTWGALRPKVMVPAAADRWSDDRIRVVLSHEFAHVRRGDWVWQM